MSPGDPITDDPIAGDTADWTWVLERPCPECGFDVSNLDPTSVAELVRENAGDWNTVLGSAPDFVRQRPRPDKWSPLEYACHVRDVFAIFDRRLEQMLNEDGPHYENWDQDATARSQDYAAQDPDMVAAQINAVAQVLSMRFDMVEGDQWDRTGYRSDGAEFTVTTFARYFIHDPVHHLWDVGPLRDPA